MIAQPQHLCYSIFMDACTHTRTHTTHVHVQSKAISSCNPNQIFWACLISLLLHAQNVNLLKNTAYFWDFSPSSPMFKLENHRAPTFDWCWSVCWAAKRIKSYNSLNIQSYYDTPSKGTSRKRILQRICLNFPEIIFFNLACELKYCHSYASTSILTFSCFRQNWTADLGLFSAAQSVTRPLPDILIIIIFY